MYLVIHHDEDRGRAIVEALGGPEAARLVPSAVDAMRFVEAGGRPRAVLACPDDIEGLLVAHELPAEPDRPGVPILYDGGRTGPLYRAFAKQWQARTPFHHLRDATPAQAAEALRALASSAPAKTKARPSVQVWAPAVLATAFLGGRWVAPTLEPVWLDRLLAAAIFLLVGWEFLVAPTLAAVRRGLRPSAGALVFAAVGLIVILDGGRAALRSLMGG